MKIDPRVTMCVDAAVAGLFLLSAAPPLRAMDWRVERRVLVAATFLPLLLAVPAAALLARVNPPTLTADGLAGQAGGLIRLEPAQWVGQRLRLLPYISGVAAKVDRGEWQVVLMHPDCGHCRDALSAIVDDARTTGRPTLLLNVSREEETDAVRQAARNVPNLYAGRLDPSHLWSAATPQYLFVSDGKVTAAR